MDNGKYITIWLNGDINIDGVSVNFLIKELSPSFPLNTQIFLGKIIFNNIFYLEKEISWENFVQTNKFCEHCTKV